MNTLALFLGVLCLVAVQARHTDKSEADKPTNDDQPDSAASMRDYRASQMRHRRKRWQMGYGYDYPPPNPYYADRRDYDRNQDLAQILRQLDEISAYVRQIPQPVMPQPIYVPYPVPYPVPQNCTCNVKISRNPNVTKRFPDMEDTNQNWGFVESNDDYEVDDGTDGARPISFDPIQPARPMNRPAPKVEHGSTQASGSEPASQAKQERTPARQAGPCNAATLTCCNDDNQRACFTRMGCAMTYARNKCSRESIAAAIEAFRMAYSPS